MHYRASSTIYWFIFRKYLFICKQYKYSWKGGVHLSGFKTALTKVVNDYARRNNYLKEKDVNLTGEDIREGITGIVSVKLPEPQFEGQTKTKLGNTFMRGLVESITNEEVGAFLEKKILQ